MQTELRPYSACEEVANSVTHGIGIVLAIAALCVLAAFASLYGDAWHIVSVSVYGTTLILLYTASTLYHSARSSGTKHIFRILDQTAIYLLIAGTYTPFTLVSLRDSWGWWLFVAIWGVAALGIVLQMLPLRRWKAVTLGSYVGMGWAVIVAIKPLLQSVATGGLVLLFSGGLAYSTGILFYTWETLKFHHALWHIFVLAGSILHFFAVLFYVIPVLS